MDLSNQICGQSKQHFIFDTLEIVHTATNQQQKGPRLEGHGIRSLEIAHTVMGNTGYGLMTEVVFVFDQNI